MALSLQTNVASIDARRHLAATQATLDGALARLSSGLRITRASDDAAGLGVSTKLESRIRSSNQAARNAGDGLSLVQVAEAALGEQASILTRLRELAMQSASDGVGDVERTYLDKEAQALVSELDRISQVTEYDGRKLLDGSGVRLDFQVGVDATANDVISAVTVDATLGSAAPLPPAAGAKAAANAAYLTSITVTAPGNQVAAKAAATAASLGVLPLPLVAGHLERAADYAYLIGGSGLVSATAGGGTAGRPALDASFAAFAAALQTNVAPAAALGTAIAAATAVDPANGTTAGWMAFDTFLSNYFAGGGVLVAGLAQPGAARTAALAALAPTPPLSGLGVRGLSLAGKGFALTALGTVDGALAKVSAARAGLGATGNRLQRATATIQSSVEALSAANARIKDVDVAEEASRLSRAQILAQAGVSVLAQANQLPQLALKLLG